MSSIFIIGGFTIAPLAYSTGGSYGGDHDDDDDHDWDWKKQDWDKHKPDCKCKQPDKLIVDFQGPSSISETNPAIIKIYKKLSDIGIKDPIIPEITINNNGEDIIITAIGKKKLDDNIVFQVLVGGSEIARIKINIECEPEVHIGDTYKNTDQTVILTIVSGSYDDKQSIFYNNDLLCTGATLKVKKVVISDNEDDKFTLQITNSQGGIEATSEPVGDGGTLGPQLLPVGEYTVSETGINLANYNTSFSGDCDKNGKVDLKKGKQAECIITNTKKIPARITIIKALTNDNNGDAKISDFVIKLTKVGTNSPILLDFDGEESFSKEIPAGTYTLSEEIPPEAGVTASYTTVLIAAGNEGCPSKLGEPFTLNEGQQMTCTTYNDDNFVQGQIVGPGVIFHYNTMAFSFDSDSYGDSCDNVGTMPCIELANAQDGTLLIVDEKITSDTLIFLFSVIEQDKINNPRPAGQMGILASSPLCIFNGVSPHDEEYALFPGDPTDPGEFDNPVNNPSGKLGFAFTCTLADPSGKYNVNYALVETV